MRIQNKHHVGFIRPLPRWHDRTQRRALADYDMQRLVDLSQIDNEEAMREVRKGDVVVVYLLHVLADRSILGTHPRKALFWWLENLVRRGAIIVEAARGRRADTSKIGEIPILLEMTAEAVETITRGTIGRKAAMLARANGALSDGRPKRDNEKHREAAREIHLAPRDKRLTGRAYVDALAKLGWTRTAAYAEFGGRDGE